MSDDAGHECARRPAVFVTGGSSGIGAAIAEQFAKAGYTVGSASRRGTVPTESPNLVPLRLDVTDGAQVEEVLTAFAETNGGLRGVVNAAGYHEQAPSDQLEIDELRTVLETNFVSTVRIAQLAFPHLKSAGGFIANIGSFYARLGVPQSLAYSASKGAMDAVTRTLAVEWARFGISVLNFAPGYVETELNASFLVDEANRERITRRIPVRRVGSPDEIARLVVAVLTANEGFLTGETITIDGGQVLRL